MSKWYGEAESRMSLIFEAAQAMGSCIIFIDEIDSLARSRDSDDSSGTAASATNTLLQMMDGFSDLPNVIVMAATNYPWQLDAAILSRFQEKIYVHLNSLQKLFH